MVDQDIVEINEIVGGGLDYIKLRRFFYLLVKQHWQDPQNHGDYEEQLKCLIVDEDLRVGLRYTEENADGTQSDLKKSPAVLVGFPGGLENQVPVLNGVAGQSDDLSSTYYTETCTAQVAVTHTHKYADTALCMATSTLLFLQGIRPSIMANLELRQMQVNGLTDAVRINPSPDDIFKVDLSARIVFNVNTTVNLESHRITRMIAELNSSN